jgi:DNA helicase-2/ATP-dependent DNA helicase PcrA
MIHNEQQSKIIEHVDGPCLVTAVPGSGKTATLTERVKRLVAQGKDPASILAITFTNKAAKEMRNRIAAVVGPAAAQMTISTFHSFCARVLRNNAAAAGLRENFTIYDEDQQEKLVSSCTELIMGDGYKGAREFYNRILRFLELKRNALLTDVDTAKKCDLLPGQMAIIDKYFARLKEMNAVDFTGLLYDVVGLFDKHPKIREFYADKFKYISVDEVQDTNVAQYKLICQLGLGHKNVLFCGDFSQSIYSFRCANPENILRFETDFGAKVLKLEKNYRSTPNILKHSQLLIEHNVFRKDTKLTTDNKAGEGVRVIVGETDREMADSIVEDIRRRLNDGTKPSQVAVLFRVNHASRALEQALRAARIGYRVFGGMSFFKRKEVKYCMAILKSMCNPLDILSFEDACDACCLGVGPKTLEKISAMVPQHGGSMLSAAVAFANVSPPKVAGQIRVITDAIEKATKLNPEEGLLHIAHSTAFWKKMQEDKKGIRMDRCDNIVEVARDVGRYCREGGSLSGYLQNVSLLSSSDEESADNEVNLMTMHTSKGLEFDVVYISHAVNGVTPHYRSIQEADKGDASAIEEERRLFYVAMTRAKKVLRIALYDSEYRNGKYSETQVSPFVYEAGLIRG